MPARRVSSPFSYLPRITSSSMLLLLLLLASLVAPATGQHTACGNDTDQAICSCTVEKDKRTVDCSAQNLTRVPEGIPNDTVILNLYGNHIILREEYERPFLPLVKLRHLDLGRNNIATIDPTFLKIFDRLESLVLVSNKLLCDTRLLWFKNWLLNKSTRTFYASGVLCFAPEELFNETVETASFGLTNGVQWCYKCDHASTNTDCNQATSSCSTSNTEYSCQNEVHWNNGTYTITKQCQTLAACLNNTRQNENDCNSGKDDSVCWYCCQGHNCNAPESAIFDGYQFPFPDTIIEQPIPTTAQQTTFSGRISTSLPLPATTIGQETTTPVKTTTPAPSTRKPTTPARPTALTYCPAEVTQGVTGTFSWPQTFAGGTAKVLCAYDTKAGHGKRTCLNGESTHWDVPDTSECPTASSILEDLSNTTIRKENALDVSEALTNVTSVPDVLKPNDVTNVVDTLENLVNALSVYKDDSTEVLRNVLGAVNQLTAVPGEQLVTSQLDDDSSSRLLRSIDDFNRGVQFQSNIFQEDTPSVDLALVGITDPGDNGLLFFGSGRRNENTHPNVVYNASSNADGALASKSSEPDTIVKGSMYMPNSLLKSVGSQLSRCQFVMYEETTFFDIIQKANKNRTISNKQEDEGETIPTTESEGSGVTDGADSTTTSAPSSDCISTSCRPGYQTIINSVVISGAVGDLTINNLDEPVTITFQKTILKADNPRCVFWDEAENDGWGGWSNEGCSLDISNKQEDNIVCKCNHLTNFAMLMDVYNADIPEDHDIPLSVISYVGCSLSLIGLVLTLISYTCCGPRSPAKMNGGKFRGDKRSKVLVNFVVSLILVNVFFIAGSLTVEFQDSLDEVCTAMAVCLHYSLLVAMAWMAIQAFNMYMALVKVFATYYSHFLLKMMLGGWGIPLVIVGITIGVDLKNYGNKDMCWMSGISFYVAFLLPICLVLIFNAVVFVAVTWKLCKLRKSKISNSDRFDLASQMRASVSITFLLGLTWILGIFAIGEASLTFNYLFAIFNSLQGFAVFVFQCLLQPEMRQRWVAACCPYCAPETADSKSTSVYSTTRRQTDLVNQPNWRSGTQRTTVSTSYVENPVYDSDCD